MLSALVVGDAGCPEREMLKARVELPTDSFGGWIGPTVNFTLTVTVDGMVTGEFTCTWPVYSPWGNPEGSPTMEILSGVVPLVVPSFIHGCVKTVLTVAV